MNGTLYCNKCGAQNEADAQFCARCRTPMAPASSVLPAAGSYSSNPSPVGGTSPYSPAYQAVAPGSGIAAGVGVRYGGFWIRVVAAIIDAIIVRVVVSPIRFFVGGLGLAERMMRGIPHAGLIFFGSGITLIATLFGSWLYEAFMESSSYQATLGKMILGMKVTDLNGNRISFERATGRHFAKGLSALILLIGYIMVGFTERKQGLHDLLAGTLVRRT
jgi:uncharacterized RDD family membrane protein YckC